MRDDDADAIGFPLGGPERVEIRGDSVALHYNAARLRRERRGIEKLAGHSAEPIVLAFETDAIVVPPYARIDDPLTAINGFRPTEYVREEGPRRRFLDAMSHELGLVRALGRSGLQRRDVDRWLDASVPFFSPIGVSLGGVHPGFLRSIADRTVTLRAERVRTDGFFVHDLAALVLDGHDADTLREQQIEDELIAFDIALVAILIRENQLGSPLAAGSLEALITTARDPSQVQIHFEGPAFLDLARFGAQQGETISASRARTLLRELDGAIVGGVPVRVWTDPPIRSGRARPYREGRTTRRRRLFSRWFEGIRADDEGLVGATPEALALAIAKDARGIVLDGTAGIGGLTIAHARTAAVERVIAVDQDRERLAMMMHNASLYGVADRIEPVVGDLGEIVTAFRADRLVIDPPWGGRDYDRRVMRLEDLAFPLSHVLDRFDGEVVLKLPRSFDVRTLGEAFTIEAMIDERSVLKFLIARRRAKS